MVSFRILFWIGIAMLAIAEAMPRARMSAVEHSTLKTVCGAIPSAGIRKPKTNQTFHYTAQEQEAGGGVNVPIIYCSSQYFKTSSITVSVLFSSGNSGGPASSGEFLGNFSPDDNAADGGYYGYIFNVTVIPIDDDQINGPYQLTLLEYETGYYVPYQYEFHTVTIKFKTDPDPGEKERSSARING